MRTIGVMGGSGCGKSYVSNLMSEMGAHVVDADAVYHELLRTDRALLNEICGAFGAKMQTGGRLNRSALAEVVFSDPEKLKQLNAITHPYITRAILNERDRCAREGAGFFVIDAPLLYQTPLIELCEEVIFVFCPFEKRVERIMRRDGITEQQARLRIEAQPDDVVFQKNATLCIDGSQSRDELVKILRGVLH